MENLETLTGKHTRKNKTQKSSVSDSAIPKNWDVSKIEEEFFKAFERGEAHARKEDKKKLHDTLVKNIEKATTLSENIFHTSKNDFGVNAEKAFLRVSSLTHFEALIAVHKADFINPKMLEVYKKSFSIKSAFNNNDFRIDFKFMPTSESLNSDLITSDGYIFEYAG